MNKNTSFKTLFALLNELTNTARDMEAGKLGPEDMERFVADAREIYERAVVLRYKAYELLAAKETPSVIDVNEPDEVVLKGGSFKVGALRATEVAPNQISLIDSIEELSQDISTDTSAPPAAEKLQDPKPVQKAAETNASRSDDAVHTINNKFKGGNQSTTVASKLNQQPIANLKAAMSLNLRFLFTKELFNKDASAFELAVEKINQSGNYHEAETYIKAELYLNYAWDKDNPHTLQFMDLVQRRFL